MKRFLFLIYFGVLLVNSGVAHAMDDDAVSTSRARLSTKEQNVYPDEGDDGHRDEEVRRSHNSGPEEDERRAQKEEKESGVKRAMAALWAKIEGGEVDGKELPDKALRNLANFGPDESDTWVRAEEERRELVELDRLINERNQSKPDRGAPDAGDEYDAAGSGSSGGTPPPAATDYDAPGVVVDIEGDMAWASSEEGMAAPIEFPEIVEFFLTCLAKPWQQGVGIQRMTYTDSPEPAQELKGPIFFRPIVVNQETMRNDALLARKTIKAVGRGFITGRKAWTPLGANIPPMVNALPPAVAAEQKKLQALYEKDPNDWTGRAQEFWKKHNRDERHLPTTLYEEAVHRWFIKSRGPKDKIRSFAALAWYVALAGGRVSNHHDAGAYTKIFTTEAAYMPGGVRSPYGLAVFNNLQRYFYPLLQKIFVDTHQSKDAGTPQEKAFAVAMRDLFAKAPGAIVSIWQLRNGADKAIEKIYKEDVRISVEEDHQPGEGETAWKKEEVKAEEVVTFVPDKPKQSQKRQYPDTMKFFTSPEGKKASGWQRALALTRTGKGLGVLPFNMDAAYDPLLMRKIIKHAALYIAAPEKFTEEGAPKIRPSDIHNAIASYKSLMKEYAKNRRKWSKRVYEIWDTHMADANRPPQTYLEEAVYRWYFKTMGPGSRLKNTVGQTKKLPEGVFEPLALYAALNGATVMGQDSVKLYHRPVDDLKTDRYQRPRAPYLHMMEHFIASRYARFVDAVNDDFESKLSDEQIAFGAGLKGVLDAHYSKMPAMGLLYVRMLVADQVMAHYKDAPKSVRKMRNDAERALKG